MVLFTIVMVCTGLALSAGPLWYRSLLSWSVSMSDPISWATMVPFTIVMVCTGLAMSAGPLWYCSLLSWSGHVWPYLLTTVVLFVHYCHGLYRSGPICWAAVPFTIFMLCIQVWPTVVLFTIVMVCTGLALSAEPLWYCSLLSCSVQVWPYLLGHCGTIHYCHALCPGLALSAGPL